MTAPCIKVNLSQPLILRQSKYSSIAYACTIYLIVNYLIIYGYKTGLVKLYVTVTNKNPSAHNAKGSY